MEANHFHFSAMDEFRRVLLPMELCENLGWKKGSKVNAINQPDKALNIRATDDGEMVIDELGLKVKFFPHSKNPAIIMVAGFNSLTHFTYLTHF